MSSMFELNRLPVGQSAYVTALALEGPIRRRMMDLGLVQGTQVEAVMSSPSGDPVAYGIRGAVIALRSEDARQILVQQS
jgi:ferrous iron transport protein A